MELDDKMIAHDDIQGWHLDKRISVAHIFTTLSFIVALGSVMWAIETRVTRVENRVTTHELIVDVELTNLKSAELIEQRLQTQRFSEIKLQLNRLEDKVDRQAEIQQQRGIKQ